MLITKWGSLINNNWTEFDSIKSLIRLVCVKGDFNEVLFIDSVLDVRSELSRLDLCKINYVFTKTTNVCLPNGDEFSEVAFVSSDKNVVLTLLKNNILEFTSSSIYIKIQEKMRDEVIEALHKTR